MPTLTQNVNNNVISRSETFLFPIIQKKKKIHLPQTNKPSLKSFPNQLKFPKNPTRKVKKPTMAASIIGDALRQAFMPKHEYESLREEDKAWTRLQRPISICVLSLITLSITISTLINLRIVFPTDQGQRPFCHDLRIQPLHFNISGTDAAAAAGGGDTDRFPGAYYLTDQEVVDYFWMVVFVPSALVFAVSSVYLVAGKFLYAAFSFNG